MHFFCSNLRYTDEFVRSPNESGSEHGQENLKKIGLDLARTNTNSRIQCCESKCTARSIPESEAIGRPIPPIHTSGSPRAHPYPNFDATPVNLSLHLSIDPPIPLSVYPSIDLFIHLSIHPSIYRYLSAYFEGLGWTKLERIFKTADLHHFFFSRGTSHLHLERFCLGPEGWQETLNQEAARCSTDYVGNLYRKNSQRGTWAETLKQFRYTLVLQCIGCILPVEVHRTIMFFQ